MKKKLLEIINHYGVMPQLKYFQSEVFELNEAIIRERELYDNGGSFNYHKELLEHIAEEIADVMVMLEQIKFYYDIEDMDIKEIMLKKINRQIERIRKEEEENE